MEAAKVCFGLTWPDRKAALSTVDKAVLGEADKEVTSDCGRRGGRRRSRHVGGHLEGG